MRAGQLIIEGYSQDKYDALVADGKGEEAVAYIEKYKAEVLATLGINVYRGLIRLAKRAQAKADRATPKDGETPKPKKVTTKEVKEKIMGLLKAMEGLGTDEEAIYSIIESISTRGEWLQLEMLFRGNTEGPTMLQYIEDELSSGEMERVYKHLNSIGVNTQKESVTNETTAGAIAGAFAGGGNGFVNGGPGMVSRAGTVTSKKKKKKSKKA